MDSDGHGELNVAVDHGIQGGRNYGLRFLLTFLRASGFVGRRATLSMTGIVVPEDSISTTRRHDMPQGLGLERAYAYDSDFDTDVQHCQQDHLDDTDKKPS